MKTETYDQANGIQRQMNFILGEISDLEKNTTSFHIKENLKLTIPTDLINEELVNSLQSIVYNFKANKKIKLKNEFDEFKKQFENL